MNPRAVIFEVSARLLYWVILAASLWVLLRGHNEPGGGFIGGLVAVSASVLWATARGPAAAMRRLPTGSPLTLAVCGVLIAGIAGLPGLLGGEAFLKHWWGSLPLGLAEFKVSTVLLFDVGVYLCVWGALSGYAFGLLEQDPEDPAERRP